MDERKNQITLSDGRTLGYAEFGDLEGSPEFYFPGLPGSRVEGRIMEETARRLSVRIIVLDRPGFGLSTSKPGRTLLDWPDDVVELADFLGLDKFSVMGHSAGGAYAAACAIKIPERLTGVGMVSSAGPADAMPGAKGLMRAARFGCVLSRRAPRLLSWAFSSIGRCMKWQARNIVPLLGRIGPESDRLLLAQPWLRNALIASHSEAVRASHEGVCQDLRILASPWGFNLADIRIGVHVWHGKLDTVLSPDVSRYIADAIPVSRFRMYRDEGHVSVPINRMEDILGAFAFSSSGEQCKMKQHEEGICNAPRLQCVKPGHA
jgi:pimeloyl-ACP methyl ester carboxylesterase